MLSHDSGDTSAPLLDETIGQNLARTAATFVDREALVECQTGRRWSYGEFHLATRRIATALLERGIRPGDRVGIWSPNTAEWTLIQYATAEVGAILVTINPAYQSHELEYVLNQSSMCMVFAARSFKTSDYVDMLDAVRGRCDALREVVIIGSPAWDGIERTAVDGDALDHAVAPLRPGDPINIQYTSGTTGLSQGRHPDPHQHPQQRLLRRRGTRVHRRGPGVHTGALLPLLRHGDGKPGMHVARRRHGDTGPGFRPRGHAESRCGAAMHVTVWGADDVHRRAGAAQLRRIRPEQPANRHHGRLALSRTRDAQRHRTDAHERRRHLLRDDRNVAGVDPDPADRHPRPDG